MVAMIDVDDSLVGYDSDLRHVWGPWIRRYGGSDAGLGFARINILHQGAGLRSPSDIEMPAEVDDVDRIIRQLPQVMQKVAKEWWGYNQCVSKQAVCREMVLWYAKRGVDRRVNGHQLDVWINVISFSVWVGLGSPKIK